tara:strand:+ start:137 stop:622 length:486 start_codon:yes stop_codon:yes gene_type:complete
MSDPSAPAKTQSSQERLYFLLQIAAHRLKTEADAALVKNAGLTTTQVAVLNLVRAKEPDEELNQRTLARALRQNESAMTAMISRLLKLNLIARKRSKADKRNWVLSLTKEGEQALHMAYDPFREINARLDKLLGKADVKKLATQLEAIATHFSEDDGSPTR